MFYYLYIYLFLYSFVKEYTKLTLLPATVDFTLTNGVEILTLDTENSYSLPLL